MEAILLRSLFLHAFGSWTWSAVADATCAGELGVEIVFLINWQALSWLCAVSGAAGGLKLYSTYVISLK